MRVIKNKSTDYNIVVPNFAAPVEQTKAEKNDRGIIYAVYHFLENIVGICWWSYWEEYVPDLSELTLQDDFYFEALMAYIEEDQRLAREKGLEMPRSPVPEKLQGFVCRRQPVMYICL